MDALETTVLVRVEPSLASLYICLWLHLFCCLFTRFSVVNLYIMYDWRDDWLIAYTIKWPRGLNEAPEESRLEGENQRVKN